MPKMHQKLLRTWTSSLLFTVLFFGLSIFAHAEKIVDLKATDYVNDFAGVLTVEQKLELSKTLGDLERQTGKQVAVAIVNDLDGDYIEHYAVKLFETWGIGKGGNDKNSNEGVLFLIAIKDKQMRIEVGYGLESTLTDGISQNILDNYVKPEFTNGDYYAGIKSGIDGISTTLNGGEVVVPREVNSASAKSYFNLFLILFVVGINILGWLFAIMARSKSWWLGGVVCFVIGFPILFFLGFSIVRDFILFIFTLTGFIFDFFVSKNYKYWQSKSLGGSGASSPAWWAGGIWGGGINSRDDSGFGGFGGGGFSGGGGASSSW